MAETPRETEHRSNLRREAREDTGKGLIRSRAREAWIEPISLSNKTLFDSHF